MVVERTSRLAEQVASDISKREAESKRREKKWLKEAQTAYDRAEVIAGGFNLVEDLQETFREVQNFHKDATYQKTLRPTAGRRSDGWSVQITWGNRLSFGVAINNGKLRVISDSPSQTVFDPQNVTKEELDSALFRAYKTPSGTNQYD